MGPNLLGSSIANTLQGISIVERLTENSITALNDLE